MRSNTAAGIPTRAGAGLSHWAPRTVKAERASSAVSRFWHDWEDRKDFSFIRRDFMQAYFRAELPVTIDRLQLTDSEILKRITAGRDAP